MRKRSGMAVLATVAVGGALTVAGCGGGGDTTESGSGSTPASQVTDKAMKHEEAMKDHGDAMKHDTAMKDHGEAMKDR